MAPSTYEWLLVRQLAAKTLHVGHPHLAAERSLSSASYGVRVGYVLQGVIAATWALRPCRAFVNSVVADLDQGLGLMPMTPVLFDEVRRGGEADPRFAPALLFPPGFEAVLAAWSAAGPVAYVEAEYFGGTGSQFAAVWRGRNLVLGPLIMEDGESRPAAGWSPISQALRHLGVTAAGHYDEFDAIRLGRHRNVEDWVPADPPS